MSSTILAPAQPQVKQAAPRIVRVSAAHFIAESRSVTLGVHTLVLTDSGEWECDCFGYDVRFTCAHRDAVSVRGSSVRSFEVRHRVLARLCRLQRSAGHASRRDRAGAGPGQPRRERRLDVRQGPVRVPVRRRRRPSDNPADPRAGPGARATAGRPIAAPRQRSPCSPATSRRNTATRACSPTACSPAWSTPRCSRRVPERNQSPPRFARLAGVVSSVSPRMPE